MALKPADRLLEPDPRFAGLVMIDARGVRLLDFAEHHRCVAGVDLAGSPPVPVRAAFDQARHLLVYAYFYYEMLVNAELQALGAVELALRHRLDGSGAASRQTLGPLCDRARAAGLFAKAARGAPPDRLGALVHLRNGLSHGTNDVHSPGMAIEVLQGCAWAIDTVFPPRPLN